MKVKDYLLKETKVHELCVIRESGYITETVYIDWEDLFLSAVKTQDREIKEVSTGAIQVRDKENKITFVPVTNIEV